MNRQEVAGAIRARIEEELQPGDWLPSEQELAAAYGTSAATARNALEQLRREDLWEGVPGRGRRVKLPRTFVVYANRDEMANPDRIKEGIDVWTWEARAQGFTGTQVIEDPKQTTAGRDARRWLDLGSHDEMIVRPRTRYIDGAPDNLCDTLYPLDIAEIVPEVKSPADVPQGIISLMASRGIAQVRFRDELLWREPSPEEKRRLDLPSGISVLQQARTGYSESRAVKCTVTIWPGHNHRIVYDLEDIHG